jgi:hypothetical protein
MTHRDHTRDFSRRTFLKSAGAGSALALASEAATADEQGAAPPSRGAPNATPSSYEAIKTELEE